MFLRVFKFQDYTCRIRFTEKGFSRLPFVTVLSKFLVIISKHHSLLYWKHRWEWGSLLIHRSCFPMENRTHPALLPSPSPLYTQLRKKSASLWGSPPWAGRRCGEKATPTFPDCPREKAARDWRLAAKGKHGNICGEAWGARLETPENWGKWRDQSTIRKRHFIFSASLTPST